MTSPDERLEEFLDAYLPEIATVARATLARLGTLLPGAVLLVYDNYNALAFGFGGTDRPATAPSRVNRQAWDKACRSVAGMKAIAHAGFGAEVPRLGGIRFHLSAHLGQVYPQIVRLPHVLRAPDLSEQLALGDQAAGIAGFAKTASQIVMVGAAGGLSASLSTT